MYAFFTFHYYYILNLKQNHYLVLVSSQSFSNSNDIFVVLPPRNNK